jgi:hypothetical protein
MSEKQIYEAVAAEIAARRIKPGLWARAYAETDGDESKSRARYIRYRYEEIRADDRLRQIREAKARVAEEKRQVAIRAQQERTREQNALVEAHEKDQEYWRTP